MATTFRDKIKARKAKEAADKAAKQKPKPTPKKPEPEKGFFDSFFNRGDTIDDAVDNDRKRKNQSTDGNN